MQIYVLTILKKRMDLMMYILHLYPRNNISMSYHKLEAFSLFSF